MNRKQLNKLLFGEFSWQRLGRSVLFVYISLASYIYFFADSKILLPQAATYRDTPEILKIPVTAKEKISAIYLPNTQAKYTILYIHGNAEDLGDIRSELQRLRELGFNVFAYDYRGYGTSDGKPSEANVYEDAEVGYRYLKQQLKIDDRHIIIYGRSVGGGSAKFVVPLKIFLVHLSFA